MSDRFVPLRAKRLRVEGEVKAQVKGIKKKIVPTQNWNLLSYDLSCEAAEASASCKTEATKDRQGMFMSLDTGVEASLQEKLDKARSAVAKHRHMWERGRQAYNYTRKWIFLARAHLPRSEQEMVTIAWLKMQEMLSHLEFASAPHWTRLMRKGKDADDNRLLRTAHLCEFPGAFAHALIDRVARINASASSSLEIEWFASSLADTESEKMLRSGPQSFAGRTHKLWEFGREKKGDILMLAMIHDLWARAGEAGIDFATGDGGFEVKDPNKQEHQTFELIFCTWVAIMGMLVKGGIFLLKIFGALTPNMAALIWLTHCVFDRVELIKPAASKRPNAESYLIGIGYHGPDAIGLAAFEHFQKCIAENRVTTVFQSSTLAFGGGKHDGPREDFWRKLDHARRELVLQQCIAIQNIISGIETVPSNVLPKDWLMGSSGGGGGG